MATRRDFGYDVSNHCDVDPRFGTLGDFDALLTEAHRRGLRLILDFIPNHTSDRHAWFLDARSSRQSSKRDWYIWHDPAPDGGPPNNWLSEFGGSAWHLDEATGQYYYHIASRVGAAQARVAAVLLCTLRGTPTLYYGDELGMRDVPIPPEAVHDPYEKNVPGLGLGRDPERTPMQWSAAPHAGFSSAPPWLPVSADYARNNVEAQRQDPASMLSLYRSLLALRRARPALSLGGFLPLEPAPNVLGYLRTHGGSRDAVLLNLSSSPQRLALPGAIERAQVALSTHPARAGRRWGSELLPDEAVVLTVSG